MKQAISVAPMVALASFLVSVPARAAGQPGDYSFTATIGESGTKKDNSYRSAEALSFAVQYQKTGFAAYRAMVGFFSMSGREAISPAAGTRDADAFFVTGNLVFPPRFHPLHPYATAGVGFYDVRLTDSQDSQNGIEVGLNWGVGLSVQIVRLFAIHGELSYHYLTGGLSNPVQMIVVGGRFDF